MRDDDRYPLDWRRLRRYLASDITWIRSRVERGDLTGALYTVRVVRSYLQADIQSRAARR